MSGYLPVIIILFLFMGTSSFAQLPDPNSLFIEEVTIEPVVLDSTTAEFLASDSLTAYELALLEKPDWSWKYSLSTGINANQSTYSGNWDGNEKGSLIWTFFVIGQLEKQLSLKANTRTSFNFSFGQTHNQDNLSRYWQTPSPSTDRIDIESLFRFTLGKFVDPFVSGRFQSAFLDSRDTTDFYVNPIHYTESMGISKALIKTETKELLLRTGFALRQNADRNDNLVVDGKNWSNDGGLELVADIKTPFFSSKIQHTARVSLYQALFSSDQDNVSVDNDYWRQADIDIESVLTSSITKYLSVRLDVWWRYDREVSGAGRLKQALSLGISYSLDKI
jgi:hypothetical protein